MTTTDSKIRRRSILVEQATHDNMATIEGDPAAIDPVFAAVRNLTFERQGYQGVPSGNSLIESAMGAEARRREYSESRAGNEEAAQLWRMVAFSTGTAGSDHGKKEFYFLVEAAARAKDPRAILAKLEAEAVTRLDAIAEAVALTETEAAD